MEEYIGLIGSLGFPIAMCLWFMFKTDKALGKLTEAINALTAKVT